ncbi:MAG: NAD-dependent epimerase/dehydratase family protein [Candidatus Nitrosopelagicus sp.]|nr:NAD-dependent epimerase/dehydratase family protein [Candidatus Nitrosopelagicus sp.]
MRILIKNKKILITGIYGFLGRHLAQKLQSENEIIGINQPNQNKFFQLPNLNIIEGDISDVKTLENITTDVDLIFHFGSPTSIVLFKKDPIKYYENTINGMNNILQFAKNNSVKKLIYPSSGSVYSQNPRPHQESIIPKPSNQYGAAKVECESLAKKYTDDVNSVGLRIFAVYGPGEEKKLNLSSVINLFLNDLAQKNNPVIFGDGKQTRDFIYVDDAINGIINSSESSYRGIINIGSGISTSFNQIIEKIKTQTGKELNPKYVKKELSYVENLQADTKLMNSILKINPISIDSGIKKFAQYLKIIL